MDIIPIIIFFTGALSIIAAIFIYADKRADEIADRLVTPRSIGVCPKHGDIQVEPYKRRIRVLNEGEEVCPKCVCEFLAANCNMLEKK